MANDDNNDLAKFEKEQEHKWSNWERIQNKMKSREAQRTKPRQTEFKKKKKLKNIENPEWKAKFEQDKKEKERKIQEKYKEQMKIKKKFERDKKKKEEALLKKRWDIEAKKNKSGLKEKPPDIKKAGRNLAKYHAKMQQKINDKYEKKMEQQNADRQIFKTKAAQIEKKYDDAKPKKKKRDPSKRAIVINEENNAWTAVENNDMELLERIYEYYPNDIKRKDKKKGKTILHLAVESDVSEIIEYLIPKLPKSFMNAANFLGNTPILLAVFERKFECIKSLYSCPDLKKRPNLDHLNINGRTCLMQAAMRDDDELIKVLLNDCIPPPKLDILSPKHSKTALTFAVEHNKHKAVKVLVNAGASFYIKNKLGKTAKDLAKKKSLRVIIERERVDVTKGCAMSSLVFNLNVKDYIIAIIAQYAAAIPQEILDKERKEKEEKEAAKAAKLAAKKKKKKRGGRAGRGRGSRRGRGRGRG